jgi:hypothetical protein
MALSVIIFLYVAIGLMSAAGSVFISKKLFSAKGEQTFFALFLIAIAGFYLAFTAYFGDEGAWRFETGGVIAFAILGLRSLYFLLAGAVDRFRYLKPGLAALLIFAGAKILLAEFVEIPIALSLGIIVAILAITRCVARGPLRSGYRADGHPESTKPAVKAQRRPPARTHRASDEPTAACRRRDAASDRSAPRDPDRA